jgi:hypothetical protein
MTAGSDSDFDLASTCQQVVARWPRLFALAIVGGIFGFVVSELRSPVYEAAAVLEIGIDRNRAQVPDDITVRQAYDRIRGLLLADDTLEEAADRGGLAVEAGESLDVDSAFRARIRLSENPDGWKLAVLGSSAAEVERLAQAWADTALEKIAEASDHALRASQHQHALYEASCRLIAGDDGKAIWRCRSAPPQGAETMSASLLAEVEASRGILPVVSYSLLQGSAGSGRVVLWERGSLMVGGALAGLVAGVLLSASLSRRKAL